MKSFKVEKILKGSLDSIPPPSPSVKIQIITVGINPILSEPQEPGTSKLDWRYLEHNKVDRNELQIRTNSQKGTDTKMAE